MPKPYLPGGPAFDVPPEELLRLSPEVRAYFTMLHHRVFGLPGVGAGDLDADNIGPLAHGGAVLPVGAYDHHGTGEHSALDQAAASVNATAAVANPAASTVSVDTADAAGAYGAEEIALINELKADVNTLVVDVNATVTAVDLLVVEVNAVVTNLNDLKAKLRTAQLLAT